jgi:hypothetical protein
MATLGAFSDFAEDIIAKYFFRNTAPAAPPTALFIAAFTVAPTDVAGSGTEVTGGGYARISMTTGTSGTGAGSAWTYTTATGVVTTNIDALWAVCSASWGTVVAFALFDASSGGNMIARADKDSGNNPISIAITTVGVDQLKIPAGSMQFTVD